MAKGAAWSLAGLLAVVPAGAWARSITPYLPLNLEPEIEAGITYIEDNTPETILKSLREVITQGIHRRLARAAAVGLYGPVAVSDKLQSLIQQAAARRQQVRLN